MCRYHRSRVLIRYSPSHYAKCGNARAHQAELAADPASRRRHMSLALEFWCIAVANGFVCC